MYNNNQVTVLLPVLQDQNSLTLNRHSLLGNSGNVAGGVFVYYGAQYI